MHLYSGVPMHFVSGVDTGIVILIAPRVLNYVVALYLVVVGIMGLAQLTSL